MIEDFKGEYGRYRVIGERALEQMSDEALNRIPNTDGNSAAMVVRHMGGNLASRFTDFLATDGEKPWRERDAEFETRDYSRDEMNVWWKKGWDVLEGTLSSLSDADLARTVTIRGEPHTVHAALSRSLSHVAYHVGQIVLLARMAAADSWKWISIPKGTSDAYNARMKLEHEPGAGGRG